MLRRAFLSASLAGLLAACAEKAPAVPPEEVVEQIYEPYFGRAEAQRIEDAAPWTDDLRDMIEQADHQARATGAPWITINPFFGASDVVLGDLAIAAEAPPQDDRVTVVARYTNRGAQAQVRYSLVEIDGAWRIDNIRGEDWDLRSILEAGPQAAPLEAAPPAAAPPT